MPSSPLQGVLLDHVAHAVPRWQSGWDRYAVDLGAVWHSGGPGPGFAPAQLRFANQARIEVLMPWDTHLNDFLARFLAANGPGPHHLTFKVPDLQEALGAAGAAGLAPIGVDSSDPEWMEAFLHPREASGVVVQMAQASASLPGDEPPGDFPAGRRLRADGNGPVPPASLLRVVHALADLGTGRRVFCELLGATVAGEWAADGVRWVDLTWGGPLDLRLVGPDTSDGRDGRDGSDQPHGGASSGASAVRSWVGDRSGRIHHLELAVGEAAGVPGAAAADLGQPWWGGPQTPSDGFSWIPAPTNQGMGLALLGDAARPAGN